MPHVRKMPNKRVRRLGSETQKWAVWAVPNVQHFD